MRVVAGWKKSFRFLGPKMSPHSGHQVKEFNVLASHHRVLKPAGASQGQEIEAGQNRDLLVPFPRPQQRYCRILPGVLQNQNFYPHFQ